MTNAGTTGNNLMSDPICEICDRKTPYDYVDTVTGTLCEIRWSCPHCQMNASEFSYGWTSWVILFCEFGSRKDRAKAIIKETRDLYRNTDAQGWLNLYRQQKLSLLDMQVFADWMEEQGEYPEQLLALRDIIRSQEA